LVEGSNPSECTAEEIQETKRHK